MENEEYIEREAIPPSAANTCKTKYMLQRLSVATKPVLKKTYETSEDARNARHTVRYWAKKLAMNVTIYTRGNVLYVENLDFGKYDEECI